jgi:hypothetical protein
MRCARAWQIVWLMSIIAALLSACARRSVKTPIPEFPSPSALQEAAPDRRIVPGGKGDTVVRAVENEARSSSAMPVPAPTDTAGSEVPRPLGSTGTNSVVISQTPTESAQADHGAGVERGAREKGRNRDARRIALASVVAAALIAAVRWLPKKTIV